MACIKDVLPLQIKLSIDKHNAIGSTFDFNFETVIAVACVTRRSEQAAD